VKRAYNVISWIAVIVWMSTIFTSSSYPVPEQVARVSDKLLHFGAYFVLGLLYVNALAGGFRKSVDWRKAWLAVALSTLFGALDEWHQSFVPARSMSLLDVVFDFFGSGAAVSCVFLLARRRRS